MEHSTDAGAFCSCWGTELVTIHDGSQGSLTYRYRGILIIGEGYADSPDSYFVAWPKDVGGDEEDFPTIDAAKASIDSAAN